MKILRFAALGFFLIFFTGCIDLVEIIQLKADGSVDFFLKISVPEVKDKTKEKKPEDDKKLEESLERISNPPPGFPLKFVKKEEKTQFGIKTVILQFSAERVSDLKRVYELLAQKSDSEASNPQEERGKIAFDQLFRNSTFQTKLTSKNTLEITRSFTPPPAPKEKKKKTDSKDPEKISKDLEDLFMNLIQFHFEVIAPTDILSSNAAFQLERDLRWETTLGYLLKNPLTLKAEIQAPPEFQKK